MGRIWRDLTLVSIRNKKDFGPIGDNVALLELAKEICPIGFVFNGNEGHGKDHQFVVRVDRGGR